MLRFDNRPTAGAGWTRRSVMAALVLGLTSAAGLFGAAHATSAAGDAQQNWPARPLTLIVPFGPGSTPDQVARIVGERAGAILGQSIVVENKAGASGNIGTAAIARAAPDGYTFGVSITGPMVNNTLLFENLPYDPVRDLAPLTLAVHQPNVIVVPAASGITSIDPLLEAIKRGDDTYNFPSTGIGTVSHLSVEMLLKRIGARAVHVPYPSSPAALNSILAGDTQFAALPPAAVMAMIRDGRLKGLAVTSSSRSALLPDLPTLAEAGIAGIEGSGWIGFVMNAQVPAAVQARLSDALRQAIADPAVQQRLKAQYMEPVGDTPDQFRQYMKEELARWGPLIQQLGLKASN